MKKKKKKPEHSKLMQADDFSLAIVGDFQCQEVSQCNCLLKKWSRTPPNYPVGMTIEIPESPAALPTDFIVRAANQ